MTDWFEALTGFKETSYEDTRAKLRVDGETLVSSINNARYGIGRLEFPSLEELRRTAPFGPTSAQLLKARIVRGDVALFHHICPGALFQVASQFNALEMVGPDVTPEDGVTRYAMDKTQGPACAIAAGAATIFRNYFVPIGNATGQTAHRQVDTLADVGNALSAQLDVSVSDLWSMRNGYALVTRTGLAQIGRHLAESDEAARDALRGKLRVAVHWDVDVTDAPNPSRPQVSQVLCSALPVAYGDTPAQSWTPFATLVLEAAYEATLRLALRNAARGASNTVLLTLLGGGVFGNRLSWIHAALQRALDMAAGANLDVRLVSYSEPSLETSALIEAYVGT
jgi:hypothetical protein